VLKARSLVVVVDDRIAKEIDVDLNELKLLEVEQASTITYCYITSTKFLIELLDEENKAISSTYAYIAIEHNLIEPLITDATIDELGIVVISFKKGLWKHITDPPNKVRLGT